MTPGQKVHIEWSYNPTIPPKYREELVENTCGADGEKEAKNSDFYTDFKKEYISKKTPMLGSGGKNVITFSIN